MPDYGSLKVPELKKLLLERSLAVSGNKAELVARLKENDESQATTTRLADVRASSKTVSAATIAPAAEDEIDWEEDENTKSSEAVTEVTAATGQTKDPVVPPSKSTDAPSSNTSSSTVAGKTKADATTSAKQSVVDKQAGETSGTTENLKAEAAQEPGTDFAAGIPKTDLEKELEARKKRALRFGLEVSDADNIKALERAKKFGISQSDEQSGAAGVKGLDQALPERRPKRGRDGGEAEGADNGKKRMVVLGAGRSQGSSKKAEPKGQQKNSAAQKGGKGLGILDDPVQKAKAEARAKRFAAAS